MHANLSGPQGRHSGSGNIAAAPRTGSSLTAAGWWNTPRRLQAAIPAIWIACLIFLLVALYGAQQHRLALQTIGQRSAPGIIAAQRIKAGLSDMDATAANVLLLDHGAQQEAADDHYEERRKDVTETLTTIVQGDEHSDAEVKAARTLAVALATYENDVTVARLLHLRSEQGSRLVYRMTYSEMHDVLLPAAGAFDQAARSALEATYQQQQWASRITLGLCWFFGPALLSVLVVVQIYLSRHMRRTLNPGLLGATLIVAFLLFHTQQLFSQEAGTLDVVKSSFGAVSDLWQTRALAFDADAAESRWLMDTPQAPQYEQTYSTQTALILAMPSGDPVDPIGVARGAFPADAKGSLVSVVKAADTIDAKEAAVAMVKAYGTFLGTDGKLRALEQDHHHGSAVAFCIGRDPGQHDWAFSRFDSSLETLLKQVQHTFDASVAEGLQRFVGYDVLAVFGILAAAALAWAGLRPRLKEYAF